MKEKSRSVKRKKTAALVGAVLFLTVLVFLSIWLSGPILSFLRDPDQLRTWVAEKGFLARVAFVGIVILQVVVAFIPGEPVEIAAGLAFGTLEGGVLCLIGAVIGSLSVFLFVRRFGYKAVELFFPPEKHKKLRFLQTEKRADTFLFLLLFIPGTPKDLISYFAGLTPVKFSHFVWITAVSRLPSIITSTWGGDAIMTKHYWLAVWIFVVTGAVSLLGLWAFERIAAVRGRKKAEKRMSGKKASDTESTSSGGNYA